MKSIALVVGLVAAYSAAAAVGIPPGDREGHMGPGGAVWKQEGPWGPPGGHRPTFPWGYGKPGKHGHTGAAKHHKGKGKHHKPAGRHHKAGKHHEKHGKHGEHGKHAKHGRYSKHPADEEGNHGDGKENAVGVAGHKNMHHGKHSGHKGAGMHHKGEGKHHGHKSTATDEASGDESADVDTGDDE